MEPVDRPQADATAPPPPPAAGWGGRAAAAPGSDAGPPTVDRDGLVIADVPCRKCSYNLRGLRVDARCPECGAPVGVAVHGPLLRYSDPGWVKNLSRGAGMVFWGVIVGIVVAFLSWFVAIALGEWILPFAAVAGGLVYYYGAWLLTEPDPGGIGENQYGTARQIVRVTLFVGIGEQLIASVLEHADASQSLRVALVVASVAAGIIGLIGEFAMLRFLERLAQRIPDAAYAARANFLFWTFGVTTAAVTGLGGLMTLLGTLFTRGAAAGGGAGVVGAAAGAMAGVGCATAIAFVLWCVFGVMFMVLLYRLKTAFDQQASYARLVWDRVEGADGSLSPVRTG